MSARTKAFYYVLQGHVGATKLLMQIMLLLKIPTVQILKTELLLKPFLLKTKRVLKLLSLLKFTIPTLIILLINFFCYWYTPTTFIGETSSCNRGHISVGCLVFKQIPHYFLHTRFLSLLSTT